MDDRGYSRIVGPLKEMIIRGGQNIYPWEIEQVLAAHPDVIEVAVVGVPYPDWGEQVAAVVRLEGSATDEDPGRLLPGAAGPAQGAQALAPHGCVSAHRLGQGDEACPARAGRSLGRSRAGQVGWGSGQTRGATDAGSARQGAGRG